ncbi:Putative metal chaperone YciC [Lacunisphaera limnophila]|uniref:Metal chaperone YciC n=1 Tax=Lacunisphaera limnophila TaxID=1838286 RepID=A0A1D8ASE8_9BACT|nr:GTP-binding protein [Lacunisphaera limnophila]AOS43818.1 Putative metal chaperone YciC [Lacunisphaera limnophila]
MSDDQPVLTRIPVTVLTGFLGAGKTTLLNRILTEQHGRKIAVIENEFGEVGIDHQLVIQSDEELFEMNNGCICCTVRGDLIRILERLAKRKDPLDAVVIETTGLADPGPVAQTFFTAADIKERYQLDAIVTLVDAKHLGLHLDDSDEARAQVAFADVIVLNKTDLVSPDELAVLEARLRKMNAAARVHRAVQAEVPLRHVLEVGGFNLSRASEMAPNFLEPEYPFEWMGLYQLAPGELVYRLEAGPDPTMDLALVPIPGPGSAPVAAAKETAVRLFAEPPHRLAEGGIIDPAQGRQRLALPAADQIFQIRIPASGWYALFTQHHPDEFAATLLVEGGPVTPARQEALKPDHEHDEAVTSVGLEFPGDVDGKRLNAWLGELLRTKGNDIFRSKGVLAVRGTENRLVFQGVHMLFDGRFDRPWGSEPRKNTFVFIGRNLDRAELSAGFASCLCR